MREQLSSNRIRAGVALTAALTGVLSLGGCGVERPDPHKVTPTAAPSTRQPVTQHVSCKAEAPAFWTEPDLSARATAAYAQDLGVSEARITFGAVGPVHCNTPIESKNLMDGTVTARVRGLSKTISSACMVIAMKDETVHSLSPSANPEDMFNFATPDASVLCPSAAEPHHTIAV